MEEAGLRVDAQEEGDVEVVGQRGGKPDLVRVRGRVRVGGRVGVRVRVSVAKSPTMRIIDCDDSTSRSVRATSASMTGPRSSLSKWTW